MDPPAQVLGGLHVPMSGELRKKCIIAINSLIRHEYSEPFLHPVDPDLLGLPDYFDIIKRPMDLSTILAKLKDLSRGGGADGKQYLSYPTFDAFLGDVRLIFSNCNTYNNTPADEPIRHMASALQSHFEKFVGEVYARPAEYGLLAFAASIATDGGAGVGGSVGAKRRRSDSAAPSGGTARGRSASAHPPAFRSDADGGVEDDDEAGTSGGTGGGGTRGPRQSMTLPSVAALFAVGEPERAFWLGVEACWDDQGLGASGRRLPVMGSALLDLFDLHERIKGLGGYDAVNGVKGGWSLVYRDCRALLGVAATETSGSFRLKRTYERLLLEYQRRVDAGWVPPAARGGPGAPVLTAAEELLPAGGGVPAAATKQHAAGLGALLARLGLRPEQAGTLPDRPAPAPRPAAARITGTTVTTVPIALAQAGGGGGGPDGPGSAAATSAAASSAAAKVEFIGCSAARLAAATEKYAREHNLAGVVPNGHGAAAAGAAGGSGTGKLPAADAAAAAGSSSGAGAPAQPVPANEGKRARLALCSGAAALYGTAPVIELRAPASDAAAVLGAGAAAPPPFAAPYTSLSPALAANLSASFLRAPQQTRALRRAAAAARSGCSGGRVVLLGGIAGTLSYTTGAGAAAAAPAGESSSFQPPASLLAALLRAPLGPGVRIGEGDEEEEEEDDAAWLRARTQRVLRHFPATAHHVGVMQAALQFGGLAGLPAAAAAAAGGAGGAALVPRSALSRRSVASSSSLHASGAGSVVAGAFGEYALLLAAGAGAGGAGGALTCPPVAHDAACCMCRAKREAGAAVGVAPIRDAINGGGGGNEEEEEKQPPLRRLWALCATCPCAACVDCLLLASSGAAPREEGGDTRRREEGKGSGGSVAGVPPLHPASEASAGAAEAEERGGSVGVWLCGVCTLGRAPSYACLPWCAACAAALAGPPAALQDRSYFGCTSAPYAPPPVLLAVSAARRSAATAACWMSPSLKSGATAAVFPWPRLVRCAGCGLGQHGACASRSGTALVQMQPEAADAAPEAQPMFICHACRCSGARRASVASACEAAAAGDAGGAPPPSHRAHPIFLVSAPTRELVVVEQML